MKQRLNEQHSATTDFMAEIFQEGIDSGEFKKNLDSRNAATILVSAIVGLSSLSVTTGIKMDWESIRNKLLSMVLHGIS